MYTEKQLVSFGNYLLKQYGVKVYSTDGTNKPLHDRQVTHADHCNWYLESAEHNGHYLSVNDGAFVDFNGSVIRAIVRCVHEYGSRVKYDLSLLTEEGKELTRIYNVDCDFVMGT